MRKAVALKQRLNCIYTESIPMDNVILFVFIVLCFLLGNRHIIL